MMGVCQTDTIANWKSQSWNNMYEKINKTVLDYNTKYKINIHKPILTYK